MKEGISCLSQKLGFSLGTRYADEKSCPESLGKEREMSTFYLQTILHGLYFSFSFYLVSYSANSFRKGLIVLWRQLCLSVETSLDNQPALNYL